MFNPAKLFFATQASTFQMLLRKEEIHLSGGDYNFYSSLLAAVQAEAQPGVRKAREDLWVASGLGLRVYS